MTVPAEEWAAWLTPAGFRWTTRAFMDGDYREPGYISIEPAARESAQLYRSAVQKLEAWVNQFDVAIYPMGQGCTIMVRGRRVTVPSKWAVYPWDGQINDANEVTFFKQRGNCPFCNHVFTVMHTQCPGCNAHLECAKCRRGRGAAPMNVGKAWHNGGWKTGCNGCFLPCQNHEFNIGEPMCTNLAMPPAVMCREHGRYFTCHACNVEHEYANRVERGEAELCAMCARVRCWHCGGNDRLEYDERGREMYCRACMDKRRQLGDEKYDAAGEMTAAALVLPSLKARPIRMMSIEQEFCQDNGLAPYQRANDMAKELFAKGLCPSPNYTEYHHTGDHNFPCHMERDGTVNGGELVYHKLKLDSSADARKLKEAWDTMRAASKAGKIKFNLRCGMHIHIDLHGFNYSDCRALQTVFGYLEDPLFRLSAAHYGEHRAIIFSREYARPIKKGKWADNAEFVSDVLRNSHNHDALALSHYYRALRNCGCGAVEVGDVNKCKCNLGKCTAEWRIFNATSNTKNLHAYMALAQSITAWAQGRELNPEDFPEMSLNHKVDFTKDAATPGKAKIMEDWKPRLEWMFKNLTMTDGEWASMIYVMKNSHLVRLGTAYLDGLAGLRKVPDTRTVLAPAGHRTAGRGGGEVPVDPGRPPAARRAARIRSSLNATYSDFTFRDGGN